MIILLHLFLFLYAVTSDSLVSHVVKPTKVSLSFDDHGVISFFLLRQFTECFLPSVAPLRWLHFMCMHQCHHFSSYIFFELALMQGARGCIFEQIGEFILVLYAIIHFSIFTVILTNRFKIILHSLLCIPYLMCLYRHSWNFRELRV